MSEDTNSILTEKLTVLREEIETFAQRFGQTENPYLVAMHDGLEQGYVSPEMIALDPLNYLPARPKLDAGKRIRSARFLAAIRNVLIFVPVAITWAAVGEATKAFNIFVLQNAGTPANFLQFWQDGYGVLDTFWSIGSIATLDFYLVMLIIVLTGVIAFLQSSGQDSRNKELAFFMDQRVALALKLSSLKLQFADPTVQEIPQDVARSIRELRLLLAKLEAGKQLEGAGKQVAKQVSSAAALTTKLAELSGSMKESSKVMGASLAAITKSSRSAASSIKKDAEKLASTSENLKAKASKSSVFSRKKSR